MRSEELTNELAGLISRLSHRIQRHPTYTTVLQRDTQDQSLSLTLDGIEDAICGLILLHIQLRRDHQ